jgi:ABC-type amino acid transport substrate-binding protein
MRLFIILFFVCYSSFTAAETLKVGVHAFTPPLSMAANQKGSFDGFSVEFMATICKRIKATCVFKPVIFPEIFEALKSQQIDLAISNITITKAREKLWLFSLPYLASPAQFVVLSGSKINTINQLYGKKIGVQKDSDFIPFLKGIFGQSVKLVVYPQISQELSGLTKNEVDAVMTDGQIAGYWISNNEKLFRLLAKPIPLGPGYGIMTLKSNQALILRINNVIREIEADGTYLKIYDTYF